MAKTVSVAKLGHGGASRAIRDAQEEPILVSKENRPAAWIVSAHELARVAQKRSDGSDIYEHALQLLAVDLYQREVLTLGQAAKLAGLDLADFIDLCSQLHVPVLWEPPQGIGAEVAAFADLLAQDHPAD